MPARRGDLERAARPLLATNVGEVGHACKRFEVVARQRRLGRVSLSTEIGDGLGEVTHADRLDSGQCDLRARLGGTDEMGEAGATGSLGRDERARNGPQSAVERKLADRRMALERLGRDLVGGGQHRQRNREVEPGSFLAQGRRSQVDGDPALGRPFELGRRDAAANPLLRLLARAIGETDDRERRQPLLQMRLDLDAARVDADEGMSDGACEHPVHARRPGVACLSRLSAESVKATADYRRATSTSSKYSPARRPVRRFTCR